MLSEEWVTGRRYLDMEELREQRGSGERKSVEVMLIERYEVRLGGNYRNFGTWPCGGCPALLYGLLSIIVTIGVRLHKDEAEPHYCPCNLLYFGLNSSI